MKPYNQWRLEIPWLPVSLNVYVRQHFAERDRDLQTAGMVLKPYLRQVLDDVGVPGPLPWKARMTFEVWAKAERDDDNCVVARKILLDAMRKLGFLADDDPRRVRSLDLPCQIDRQRPRTVIVIARARK